MNTKALIEKYNTLFTPKILELTVSDSQPPSAPGYDFLVNIERKGHCQVWLDFGSLKYAERSGEDLFKSLLTEDQLKKYTCKDTDTNVTWDYFPARHQDIEDLKEAQSQEIAAQKLKYICERLNSQIKKVIKH